MALCKMPHQDQAVSSTLQVLATSNRASVYMACGSGKTLVGMWIAESMECASRILILLPSLALVRQALSVYKQHAHFRLSWSVLAVCSDESVSDDALKVSRDEVGCPVTSDAKEIEWFLSTKHETRVVFCTYQSAELLAGLNIDLAIFDEAHKTTAPSFGFSLHDYNVKIKKRLFMTATPRHARIGTKGLEDVYSMDDESLYGPVAYRLSFREAVNRGIICDYKIVISEVTEHVDTNHEAAVQVALHRAMTKFGARKAFTFHRTVAGAERFAGNKHGMFDGMTFHINGSMPTSERDALMESFEKSEPPAIMTNAKCLTEGVDVPAVDLVAFVDPKASTIDIAQAAGRAMRKRGQKTYGIILLPIFKRSDESDEDGFERSRFRPVYDVLQAMQEQDEVLAAWIKEQRKRDLAGEMIEPSEQVVFDSAEGGEITAFQRAVTVRMLGTVSGINTADEKKRQLLDMARKGEPRPKPSTEEGQAVINYTAPSRVGKGFDPLFKEEIQRLAPHWFANPADEYKRVLLDMAARGQPKPTAATSELHKRFRSYINPSRSAFDQEFLDRVKHIAPTWLSKERKSDRYKGELLEMASSGKRRPSQDTSIGKYLTRFVDPSDKQYDAAFTTKIKKLAPLWFNDSKKVFYQNLFLTKAKCGEGKPMDRRLNEYTKPNSSLYDPVFDVEIRRLAPHWFKK